MYLKPPLSSYTFFQTYFHFFFHLFFYNYKDSDTGGWSPFSNWSACSTNCGKGVRYRYRFCDSPPPRYGAKFCEVSVCVCTDVINGIYDFNQKINLKKTDSFCRRKFYC